MTSQLRNSRRAISPVLFWKAVCGNISEHLIFVIISSEKQSFGKLHLLQNLHEEACVVHRHFVEARVTA